MTIIFIFDINWKGGILRLRIKFKPKDFNLVLPCQYNGIVQAFIYKHLDEWLANKIHDKGFTDPFTKRQLKLFTFSRLIPENGIKIHDKQIFFKGCINLVVSSPYDEFIQSFAINLLRDGMLYLGEEALELVSVEVEAIPPYKEKIVVKTLSPITVYSTLESATGKKKTYYYSPFEREFEELLLKNLQRKLRTWSGDSILSGSIRPYKVSSKNQRVVIYKNTVIKGWDGIFELTLPEGLFRIAFEAGLGAKNSLGFGCIEVWRR